MVSKVAFLVLLGVAATLASPVEQANKNELLERSINDAWTSLTNSFKKAMEQIKATWADVKEKGQNLLDTHLTSIKEKALKLMEDAKEVCRQIVVEGKEAAPKLQEITNSLKELGGELKESSAEAYADFKKLIQEVIDTIKEKVKSVQH